ncbi:histidine--tRNA ligase [Candidatus Roizmanbacteria bacterium RIFCSPLOWO2_12_FULL_40_12]|uniref:Histidine--tRNA ligase n=1 Tax=Candidatus Roizmanbacteria bacterium RIFCSPLOWO2_01_FULL_40_42 TaxID=1802066 RepID=A0A1F7J5G4_9BACT|nr:MAG: histidine--tRNA ligase [Candidatus Roizmanbacteria bacterium RIFCSPHIGHO2_01_FULL_40_98]OGK28298.1 MAG: histidine--tRNA ligase [Candidatus Roizmanbacteria bacterium RIFCSPHIGHO2_02_FULL_40_53]OGK30534.1 MAG: histidine--tRNA ligase [Candidatus Roizmanbacteria bacterium RIFCSPHIGHO2_12_41_18]OGK36948.1 MAG: histidine--tRNA ligase [Candidatus Roizmanbacteria bacterium RIFCSPHIGHO2_12_FULL_40_130]OGK50854.1 MAG: histidine--tRNA ligase [Candidatus Roizmanbacteria bacterium RIFCSPLOWO2_01_FUL
MSKIKPQTLKGFRDFLPEEMKIRNAVINACREVFESFGFDPLETPTLEYASTLLEKYGDEADRLVYTFKDKGDRNVGLIYDLTVPTAKVLAMYPGKIQLPFKRYQMQRVWRADKPQKGRYREFAQCDIDIFGVKSPLADAEILAVTYTLLTTLGFKNFTIKLNSRTILFNLLKKAGIADKKQQLSVLQTIDKLDKKSKQEVSAELGKKGLENSKIKKVFSLLETAKIEDDSGLNSMKQAVEFMGVLPKTKKQSGYEFVPYMVRGLNYYTGPVFETVIDNLSLGSVAAGGRYDNLVSLLGGPDVTGTGTTFGFDRICDALTELKIKEVDANKTRVLVTTWPGLESKSMELAANIRALGISCELFLEEKPYEKQLKYADKKGFPFVILLGPEEINNNKVVLRNMKTREQKELSQGELLQTLNPSI